MSVKDVISKCDDLYRDIDFNYVKKWKERTGGKAIGFFPVYVPREIIHAAGLLPVGVLGAGDQLEIIKGDAYFQSYICHIPRSAVEMAVTGRLDSMDGFLFPAICDVIRNLSGMFKTIFEDKYIKFMDYPQNMKMELGGNFYRHELETLIEGCEKISGNKVTTEKLNNSIELYNKNRAVIKKLYNLRSSYPHLVPSTELYLIMRASYLMDVEEHTEIVEEYICEVFKEKADRIERDNIRVVASGTFCEQPPLMLIKSLEQSGCYIVEDDWVLCSRYIIGDIEITKDPLNELVDAYLNKTVSTASRYEEAEDKGKYLISCIKENNAEGAIFCAPSFCDPALLERPMLQNVLVKENIPFTSLKYSENTGQFQVIKEQSGTFADSIKLWGEL